MYSRLRIHVCSLKYWIKYTYKKINGVYFPFRNYCIYDSNIYIQTFLYSSVVTHRFDSIMPVNIYKQIQDVLLNLESTEPKKSMRVKCTWNTTKAMGNLPSFTYFSRYGFSIYFHVSYVGMNTLNRQTLWYDSKLLAKFEIKTCMR